MTEMYHDKEQEAKKALEQYAYHKQMQAAAAGQHLGSAGCSPKQAPEMSPIERQLDNLDNALSGASQRFDILSNRLRPILRDDTEKEGANDIMPSLCPVHDRLSGATYRIQILENRMLEIIERLCI